MTNYEDVSILNFFSQIVLLLGDHNPKLSMMMKDVILSLFY